jgi:hypothetical protein
MRFLMFPPRCCLLLLQLLTLASFQGVMGAMEENVSGVIIASEGAAPARSFNQTTYASEKCDQYRDRVMFDEDFSGGGRFASIYHLARINDLDSQCPSRTSNAHGTYTSRGNCYFKFHKIHNDIVPANRMSVACSDDNLVEGSDALTTDLVRHPVSAWPDACVGDYSRCYRLDHDEEKLLQLICSKKLEVPEGATHLSVDCSADKTNLKEMLQRGELDEDLIAIVAALVFAAFCLCLLFVERAIVAVLAITACAFFSLCMFLVHRYAFKPYSSSLKRSRSDPDLFESQSSRP